MKNAGAGSCASFAAMEIEALISHASGALLQ